MAQDYDDENMEYQLNDENVDPVVYEHEHDEDLSGTASEEKVTMAKKPRRNILIWIIAIVFSLLVVYKLFDIVFGGNGLLHQARMAMKSRAQTPAEVSALPAPKALTTKADMLATLQAKQQAAAGAEKAQAMQQETTQLLQAQQTNQAQLQSLAGSVSAVKSGVTDLQETVKGLAVQVHQTQSIQNAMLTAKSRAHKAQQRRIRLDKRYFVKAVIPGRAWLVGADGTALTVTVGDEVPGYGRVTAVDAYSGTVQTSSGIRIYYGVSNA